MSTVILQLIVLHKSLNRIGRTSVDAQWMHAHFIPYAACIYQKLICFLRHGRCTCAAHFKRNLIRMSTIFYVTHISSAIQSDCFSFVQFTERAEKKVIDYEMHCTMCNSWILNNEQSILSSLVQWCTFTAIHVNNENMWQDDGKKRTHRPKSVVCPIAEYSMQKLLGKHTAIERIELHVQTKKNKNRFTGASF